MEAISISIRIVPVYLLPVLHHSPWHYTLRGRRWADEAHVEKSVFLYDTEGQVWRKASPLPKVMADHSSCMIKLHQVNAAGETGRGMRCTPRTGRKKSTLGLFISKKQDYHSSSQKK